MTNYSQNTGQNKLSVSNSDAADVSADGVEQNGEDGNDGNIDSHIISSIRKNLWPLLAVGFVIAIAYAYLMKENAKVLDQLEKKLPNGSVLTIGLYKKDYPSADFFATLQTRLKEAFLEGSYALDNADDIGFSDIAFKEFANLDDLCKAMLLGEVDIAGELSPIEYVNKYRTCSFQPFLGMEYNGNAYYYSYLFAPNDGSVIKAESGYETWPDLKGFNFIRRLRQLLSLRRMNEFTQIAISSKDLSASGHYYPKAYLVRHNIGLDAAKGFNDDNTIFKTVLLGRHKKAYEQQEEKPTKSDTTTKTSARVGNRYIAGFIANFKFCSNIRKIFPQQAAHYEKYWCANRGGSKKSTKEDAIQQYPSTLEATDSQKTLAKTTAKPKTEIRDKAGEGNLPGKINDVPDKPEVCNKTQTPQKEFCYHLPLLLDKSPPIPNGVFVISKRASEKSFNLPTIKTIWKTLNDVPVLTWSDSKQKFSGDSIITGWRDEVIGDLMLVEQQKRTVDNHQAITNNYRAMLVILLVLAILILSKWVSYIVRHPEVLYNRKQNK